MSDLITISREEYDALIAAKEDLEDLMAVNTYKTAPGESVPLSFMQALLDGASPLRLWREHRGFSQNELAARSGVNRVQIGCAVTPVIAVSGI